MHAGPADTKEDALIRTACCAHSMCELIRCMYQDKAHMLDMHRAITISFRLASRLGVDMHSPRGRRTASDPRCSVREASDRAVAAVPIARQALHDGGWRSRVGPPWPPPIEGDWASEEHGGTLFAAKTAQSPRDFGLKWADTKETATWVMRWLWHDKKPGGHWEDYCLIADSALSDSGKGWYPLRPFFSSGPLAEHVIGSLEGHVRAVKDHTPDWHKLVEEGGPHMVTIKRSGVRMLINTAMGPPPLLHHIHRHPGAPHTPPARLDMYGTISATRTVHPMPRHIDLTSREERRKWELAINETPYHKPGRSSAPEEQRQQEQASLGDGPRTSATQARAPLAEVSGQGTPTGAKPAAPQPAEAAKPTARHGASSTANGTTEHELYCGRCHKRITSTDSLPSLIGGGRWLHDAHAICYMCTRPSDATLQDWGRCPLCVQTKRQRR